MDQAAIWGSPPEMLKVELKHTKTYELGQRLSACLPDRGLQSLRGSSGARIHLGEWE
jgi:hypothetical protein